MGSVAQEVEDPLCKLKGLNSNSSPVKGKKKKQKGYLKPSLF
jgi:hypothetical protein